MIKGSFLHEVRVVTEEWNRGVKTIVTPYIKLFNEEDPYYWTGFETREEVEAFIEQLKAAADQAFGAKHD